MSIRLNRFFVSLGLMLLASGPALAQEPIAVIQQNSSFGPAPAATASGPITLADMRAMLSELNLSPHQNPGEDQLTANIQRGGLGVCVIFTLSQDNSRIWIKTITAVVDPAGKLPPWQKMVEMQDSIKPAMFSYRGNSHELIVRYPLANVGISRERLKNEVDHFMTVLMSVRGAWDTQNWSTAGSVPAIVPERSPYSINRTATPEQAETVLKAVHDHLLQIGASAKEFVADSDAFEQGKALSSDTVVRDLITARRRMAALAAELDNLPTSTDPSAREYVEAYKTFARTILGGLDAVLVDCGRQMVAFLDSPQAGQSRATVRNSMGETTAKAAKVLDPAKAAFLAAESQFRQHYNLVAAN